MLTVGSIIEGMAVDLDYQGQGVVKYEGYVIFVPKLIDGEVAEIEITKLKKSFAEGKVKRLITKSADRVECDEIELGSYDLIHLSQEKQDAWQIKTTYETIKKIADIDFPINQILTTNQTTHYRNKSVFHVLNKPYLTLGLYKDKSNELVAVDHFILSDQKTNEVLSFISKNQIKVDSNKLKHIAFRTNSKSEILITLIATQDKFMGRNDIVSKLMTIPKVVGVTVNVKDHPKVIFGKKSKTLFGLNRITETLNGIELQINDRSFFQVNLPVIQMAYQLIKDQIEPNASIVDAYSGIGSIGFYLHDKVKKITMIESNPDSIEMAKKILNKHQIEHVDIIDDLAEKVIHLLDADFLIVDPPRQGLSEKLIEQVIEKSFRKIFYLSCDVKTLAKNIASLQPAYELKKVIPIKMFYQTSEIETLAILEKK
ncbi:23S rRNA (uracil(1939)-C(5))-methyltransferase RlmD [Peloplasma aerotolerans]|uniref:23S rRNA (Uracil(1939)-C(5))-methyltransferase RlmD n=1 Tax=Peloplasma aerotolerans TaxID=3044389 RepID=A0AAW6U429_9MOLU|nr:23S rRNA (uracil(1939)-C(5))-methyltransferase RlmD [Mariniplasma sp. M4Ah]MDI6452625.1 23S rRNA (uracil(1939)-C(5))-methyltransferase RlmD [Mariniplasma sp. M4Ah]MDR4969112.1 23S rRNA (uracil(1939)-C(5))-methyltransferase RlmD [Acholeplasmataceae bacterium]